MRAIYALVERGEPWAAAWIRPLLRDRESPVRNAAIAALGQLRDVESFDALVACLAAPMSTERQNAVSALAELADPRMRVPLVHVLQTEPSFVIRESVIRELSAFRDDDEVIDALIHSLTDPDEDVRATAAVALSRMRAVKALFALQHMALTDTNQETTINGLYEANSWVAQRAIEIIRSPEQASDLDWPA
jgi:HEAT repeat protein